MDMGKFEEFIVANAEADTSRLLLSNKEWPRPEDSRLLDIPVKYLAVNTIDARKKLRRKVPEWYSRTDLVYPSTLCAEQCSSSDTARYKASVARRIAGLSGGTGCRIADLTGGLGVDSRAFSECFDEVLYNEMDPALASAAEHNFEALGVKNIRVLNMETAPSTLASILCGFKPDIIFLDPARRSSAGKKVFLLEDCRPDVLALLPGLLSACRHLLLKLSPMADIQLVTERLNRTYERFLEKDDGSGWNGRWVREVHVVSSGGECKELLVWMDREWNGGYSLICREDGNIMEFTDTEVSGSAAAYPDSTYVRFLFEPGKSLTKAGVFNALCKRFGLVKLARFTHLYTFPEVMTDEEAVVRSHDLVKFGKLFKVKELLPLKRSSMKEFSRKYPHSEVTARNIPLSSEELRRKMGMESGEDAHVFGVRIETPYDAGNYLVACGRMPGGEAGA